MDEKYSLIENIDNIRKLFGVKRDALCVYQVLSTSFMGNQLSKSTIQEIIQKIIEFSLVDSTNADNLCKYMFIMSLQKNVGVGEAVRRIFMSNLEDLFKDRARKAGKDPNTYRNLVRFFMCATHYMRNPMKPPVSDLVSALLILIDSLNCSEFNEDLEVYSQAVAWIGGYFEYSKNEQNVRWVAWREALDKLRKWITEGRGGVWALSCLEAATNGGNLSIDHLPFYAERLHQWQKQALLGITNVIPLPSSSLAFFRLSNILNYIQSV